MVFSSQHSPVRILPCTIEFAERLNNTLRSVRKRQQLSASQRYFLGLSGEALKKQILTLEMLRDVHARTFLVLSETKREIGHWLTFYNGKRLHEKLNYQTPDEVYLASLQKQDKTKQAAWVNKNRP